MKKIFAFLALLLITGCTPAENITAIKEQVYNTGYNDGVKSVNYEKVYIRYADLVIKEDEPKDGLLEYVDFNVDKYFYYETHYGRDSEYFKNSCTAIGTITNRHPSLYMTNVSISGTNVADVIEPGMTISFNKKNLICSGLSLNWNWSVTKN